MQWPIFLAWLGIFLLRVRLRLRVAAGLEGRICFRRVWVDEWFKEKFR